MDEEQHPECDVYLEDPRSAVLVAEILINVDRDLLARVKLIPFGAASVGMALGLMAHQKRFPRASIVFLDGDQASATGCIVLPGEDAPERVVFENLKEENWIEVSQRIGRGTSETIDSLTRAMAVADHHEWIRDAGDRLMIGGDILWQAMAASWAKNCADESARVVIAQPIRDALDGQS